MDGSDFALKRPAGLHRILSTLSLRDNLDREVYVDFLKRAKASTSNPKGLSIRMGYDNGAKPDVAIRTCSLCTIFFFYTKVQSSFQKVGKSASYEEVENSKVSLSFYELLLLCRDFRIIPKIITKEELYYLWKVMNVQKGKIGAKVSRLVSFPDFKDFMARIAILAFNKPGIKRIIVSNNNTGGGMMPKATELISMLAKYLHLDDIEWVRNRVRTVGKATVSMINSRSAGEKNLLTRNNIREDLKGTRLAKMLSVESGDSSQKTATRRLSAGRVRVSSAGASPHRKTAPAAESKMAKKLTRAKEQALELEQKSTLSPFEDQVYLMLRDLEAMDSAEDMGDYDTSALHDFSVASGAAKAISEVDEHSVSVGGDFEGVKRGNLNISRSQLEALDQYHPSLAMVFDPYSDVSTFAKHKSQNFSNFDDTEVGAQNFLDMGTLVIGSKCVIRLTIVNDTPYEISVNTAVDGRLSNEAVKITTMPTSFCPGLSHSVFLSFIVGETAKRISCTVANIVTHCSSPSHPHFHLTNCCPVFYRAVRPSAAPQSSRCMTQYPLCNASLLDDLLDKFDLKNTLMEENTSLRYNPSSNSFTFPRQLDFTHSQKQLSNSTASRSNVTPPSTSMFEIAPGAVPALVRGGSQAALTSPVLISRSPTFSSLKHLVPSDSTVE